MIDALTGFMARQREYQRRLASGRNCRQTGGRENNNKMANWTIWAGVFTDFVIARDDKPHSYDQTYGRVWCERNP
ncbi:MAG: hypothetical protein P8R38_05260 [Planctomycetota bacterium]|nr:hypothetical protein [Planctomycetota bacterium]